MADVSPVNVSDLTKVEGTIVSKESLLTAGLISKVSLPVKILWTWDVATAYTCEWIEAFSASAKKKIEAAGWSCGVE